MFASATTSSRPAKKSHQPWHPLPYMTRAVSHLVERGAAMLWLDPGMRKTSITLAAFLDLKAAGQVETMLVIAPLRVCRLVWRQEAAKWTQFRHLTFSLLHGPKKDAALKEKADVYLINPEGVQWLAQKFYGRSLPFDVVVFDEITKFKNSQSERSKAIRGGRGSPRLRGVKYRWGLTGTPNPNGYLDLFGQFLVLDDGAALERYLTHYRDRYFSPDFNGFDYSLQPGAADRIHKRIEPYVFSLRADEYIQLPELVPDPRMIEMPPESRKIYKKMKDDLLAELPGGTVTAANSAAAYSKLSQMANGAVYFGGAGDGPRQVAHIHDAKLDALEELIDELDGKQLLVAYEFEHDRDRLAKRFPGMRFMGRGVSASEEAEVERAWNAGEVALLAAHPASIGHGLNLQGSNACHIAWFSITWDLELFDQFNRRIRRSGNEAARVVVHMLAMKDTIDDLLKLPSLRDKDTTQQRLRESLNTVLHGGDAGAAALSADWNMETPPMGMKLSRLNAAHDDDAAEGAEAPRPKIIPKGWGTQAAAPDEDDDVPAQKAAIKAKLTAAKYVEPDEDDDEASTSPKARTMFSKEVRAKLDGEAAKTPATESGKSVEAERAPAATSDNAAGSAAPTRAPTYQLTMWVTAAQMAAIAKVLATL